MLREYIKNEKGNFAVAAAGVMLPFAVVIGVTIDFGLTQSKKAKLQDALDIATMASTRNPDEAEGVIDGKTLFNQQVSSLAFDNYDMDITVNDGTYTGTATAINPLVFGGVLGREGIEMSAKTVVSMPGETAALPCLMALSTNRARGITINSGAIIDAPDCIVEISSTQNPAATINGGITLDVAKICVAGSNITDNHRNLSNLELNCPTVGDPFDGLYPVPDSSSCDESNQNYNGPFHNLIPGVYCGNFNFNNNPTVNFAPGTYVITGGSWNVNGGNWSGDGVTFYFAERNAKIQFNGGVKASFTPPQTGDYAGVFMTETKSPSNNQSDIALNDSQGFDFEGIVYLPNRNLIFNSGATTRSRTMVLAADTLTLNSGASLNFETVSSAGASGGQVTTQAYISE